MKRPLSRRSVLRGLLGGTAACLPLPALEAMLGTNGDALATGEVLPTRFGVWFWGNGTKPDLWQPTSTGVGYGLSEELAPLADVQPYVSVISGCEMKTDSYPHHSGMAGILTGMKFEQLGEVRDTIVSTFAGPSVDQLAADWFAGQTAFRSLELGVTAFRGSDEGSTFEHLSHNGPNNPNPSEYDPVALYERLFSTVVDPRRDLARQSVLDVVHDQIGSLERRLGAVDRTRLEQYLDSIRALENRIALGVSCVPGSEGPGSYPDLNGQEQIVEKNAVMSELLALALACDLSRSFSVQFSTCGSGVVMWQVGATDGLHVITHEEAPPQPTVHAAVTFTMEQLATFLRTLRDTPEGDGNLLDRASILCTSELAEGYTHQNTEFPILLAGLGGGRLVGNTHHRSTSNGNTSDAVLTALHGAGVELPSFGADAGYTTATIAEVMS